MPILYNFPTMYKDNFIKKYLAITLFCIVQGGSAYASSPEVRVISSDILECSVINGLLDITQRNGKDVVGCDGNMSSSVIGEASLPFKNFFIDLGESSGVESLEIMSVQRELIPGRFNIAKLQPPRTLSLKGPVGAATSNKIGRTTPTGVKRLGRFASSSDSRVVKLNSLQRRGDRVFASMSVMSAEYEESSGKLYRISKVIFRLKIKPGKVLPISGTYSSSDRRFMSSLAVKPPSMIFSAVPAAPDGYLLITSSALISSFQSLLDAKTDFNCVTRTIEEIESTYSEIDTQTKIRRCIRDMYLSDNVRYVLLGGDTEIIPARGVYAKVSGAALKRNILAEYTDTSIPCDLYYADTSTASWDSNSNGIYGELTDDVNFLPGVYLGRAPVSNSAEADNFVRKALYYPARYNFHQLLIGAVLDASNDGKAIMTGPNGPPAEVMDKIPSDFTVIEMYESVATLTTSDVINRITSGMDFINHAGHGTISSLAPVFSNSNVSSLSNTKPFVILSIGCYAGSFDNKNSAGNNVSDCIGEEFVKNSGGACAFIGNSRYGWYDEDDATKYSGEFMVAFYEALFNSGMDRLGEAFAKSKMDFIAAATDQSDPDNPYRWIEFELNLLGDPAMKLPLEKDIDFNTYRMTTSTPSIVTGGPYDNELVITLENLKSTATQNVTATLETDDLYVNVTSGTVSYGTIPSFGTLDNTATPFKFTVSADCPSEHTITFNLLINTTDYACYATFYVPVALYPPALTMVYSYPNPIRSGSAYIVNIPQNSHPTVSIYNLSGEEMALLKEGSGITNVKASMKAVWDLKNKAGKPVASGVYYYFLRSDLGTAKGKIAVIK